MLVITRREGEEVVIGDPRNPIGVVRIASIKGERVRVAFDFPREVEIHRREIADQILDGDAEAPAATTPTAPTSPPPAASVTIPGRDAATVG
ncbi:MAG: carbon storage regulator [Planctomycetota bacterium]